MTNPNWPTAAIHATVFYAYVVCVLGAIAYAFYDNWHANLKP